MSLSIIVEIADGAILSTYLFDDDQKALDYAAQMAEENGLSGEECKSYLMNHGHHLDGDYTIYWTEITDQRG